MRIGITAPALCRAKGGIERFAVNLGNWLSSHGHLVTLFHYPYPPDSKTPPLFSPAEEIVTVRLTRDPAFNLIKLKAHSLDALIFTNDGFDRAYLYPCLPDLDIPKIYSEHAPWWNLENEAWNHVSRVNTIAIADGAHLCWDSAADNLPDFLKHKICAIPNAIELPQKTKPLADRQKILLTVARLAEDDKQLSKLIEAFKIVADKFPDWKLRICGEGNQRQDYEELIANLDLTERVELPGNIEKIDEEYEKAAIFCISSRYECCPLSVLEAMAHGMPVIGFGDCYGVNEIITDGENGLLAFPMTSEALAERMAELIQNPELQASLAEESRKNAALYERDKIYSKYLDFIKETVAKTELVSSKKGFISEFGSPPGNSQNNRQELSPPILQSQKKRPALSVILPVFNVEPWLDKCIAFLLRQTFADFELIAVDDFSTDESLNMLEEWSRRDPRIRIIEQRRNGGLSSSRNAGLRNARGEYVYFMDSDDWIDTDYLEKMMAAAKLSKSPIILNTKVRRHALDGTIFQHEPDLTMHYSRDRFVDAHKYALNIMWITPGHLWKKDFLDKNGLRFPLNETMEDQFFQVAAYACAKEIYLVHDSGYNYLERPGSICKTGTIKNPNLKIARKIYSWLKERGMLDKIRIRLFSKYIFSIEPNDTEANLDLQEFFKEVEDYLKKSLSCYSYQERRKIDDILKYNPDVKSVQVRGSLWARDLRKGLEKK